MNETTEVSTTEAKETVAEPTEVEEKVQRDNLKYFMAGLETLSIKLEKSRTAQQQKKLEGDFKIDLGEMLDDTLHQLIEAEKFICLTIDTAKAKTTAKISKALVYGVFEKARVLSLYDVEAQIQKKSDFWMLTAFNIAVQEFVNNEHEAIVSELL